MSEKQKITVLLDNEIMEEVLKIKLKNGIKFKSDNIDEEHIYTKNDWKKEQPMIFVDGKDLEEQYENIKNDKQTIELSSKNSTCGESKEVKKIEEELKIIEPPKRSE